jgi:hypothetical protein
MIYDALRLEFRRSPVRFNIFIAVLRSSATKMRKRTAGHHSPELKAAGSNPAGRTKFQSVVLAAVMMRNLTGRLNRTQEVVDSSPIGLTAWLVVVAARSPRNSATAP